MKRARVARQARPAISNLSHSHAEDSWIRKLGPGLITGAADDDPSGIATYSQAGARFGFGLLWTILLTYPLMVSIQLISAMIGRVSGHGLASNIRRLYPRWLLYSIVGLLIVANTINIAADLAAMGDAVRLVVGGNAHAYLIGIGLLSAALQVFIPYSRYVGILKWLTMALFAYVATVFAVRVPWTEVLHRTVVPALSLEPDYVTTVVAIFGTTISPYLFFWQASQEVEEEIADPDALPLKKAPRAQIKTVLQRINIDTYVGMAVSNLVAFFIVVTAAVTLYAHGITDVRSSAQAASALKPIAGQFAFVLFTLGIVGTGLLAIPVLAGSAAYAIAGALNWNSSLEHAPSAAKGFYAVIAFSMLAGVAIGCAPVDPMKALYYSAVINGVISVPIMAVMMSMSSRREIMGHLVITKKLKFLGWLCTATMAAAALAMLIYRQ
ncbi:MAG TPA: divalent metal cation transporter [Rhodocyclaceae bacterium]|nr:divalent metal cation transporter [Rhodocyclaceae bacterium]